MNIYQSGSALRSGLITLAIVVIAIAIAATQLPQGFSSDVSVIGDGRPVIVQVHNKESMRSQEMMNMLNEIRPDYEDRVEFRVVDIAAEDGRSFVSGQRLDGQIMLVLFDASGTRREVFRGADQQALRAALNAILSRNTR